MATETESNGSIGTANLLTANAQMTGQSSSSSDIDYFKLYNSGAGTSQFDVTLPNTYSDYYIKIYDNTGTLQKSYTAYYGSKSYSVASSSAGYSYISVNSSSTTDYSISANFIASSSVGLNSETESNGSIGTANLLTANAQMTGQSSSSSDIDYFKLYNSGAGTSQFDVTLPNTYSDYYIKIYDNTGTLQKSYTAYYGSKSYSVASSSAGYSYISVNSSSTTDYSINANFIADISGNNPSYKLIANLNSVNEGSTATFTLTTTNVASGISVPYTLFGVSAADVSGGALSGNAVVNSSGVATISVTLLNDNLTEGSETLTVTAGGASASTAVIDTPQRGATYLILAEGSSGSSYYKVYSSSDPVTWDGARAVAKTTSYGGAAGYLANVTSQTENSFVTSLLPTTYWNGAWIGASDSTTEGTWRWADGPEAGTQITGYVNFAFGSYQDQEDYLQINGGNINPYKGLWDDRNQVTEPLNLFVVEYPNLVPTYVVSINSSSVNEGSTATFTLTTTNLAPGTSVPYTLSGISAADVSNGLLNGFVVINSNGIGTISIGLTNDLLQEGVETLTVSAGGAIARTVINDTSNTTTYENGILYYLRPPSYSGRTYTLTSQNELVSFLSDQAKITTDIFLGFQTGTDIIHLWRTDNIFGGRANFPPNPTSFKSGAGVNSPSTQAEYILYDTSTGRLYFDQDGTGPSPTVMVGTFGDRPSLKFSDFHISQPQTYSVSPASSSINEGNVVTFTVDTSNVPTGTTVPYTLSGLSVADLSGGSLSGTTTVANNGQAIITVLLANDNLSEGIETLTVNAGGATASTIVNDTSKGTATYSLSASSASVDEGSVATFNLLTTNVAAGTSISYTIGGVGTADITGGLTGTSTVGTNGIATIFVAVAADFLTEGAETLTVTAQSKSASMTINDTSKAVGVAAYAMSAASSSVDEGSIAVFTVTTSNVAGGTSIPYTVSGITAADVTGGALSGVAIVNASGTATISIPIIADLTTEGQETLTLTAQGKSASMTIIDTSKTFATMNFFGGSSTDDAITNSPVSQNIDGGAGIDTLLYTSTSYAVLISKSGGSTVVTNTATGEIDTLINVERLKFADTAIALDTSGVGGQVYRVYQAAFNRTPDFGGLGYWISRMDSGASLKSVAQGFVSSEEAKTLYGASPTNAQIVTKFYENVLHRAPEFEGYNYWLGMLNSGLSVSNALAAFSESPENVSGVSGAISNGIRYTPYISPTYSMFANATSVNEGGVATFTLRTTNVAAGSSIPYTLSGISGADVLGDSLRGNAVVNSSGVATISVALLNDFLTEGRETLQVTAGSATASMNVNDTSITIVGTVSGPNTGGSGFGVGGGGVGGGG